MDEGAREWADVFSGIPTSMLSAVFFVAYLKRIFVVFFLLFAVIFLILIVFLSA